MARAIAIRSAPLKCSKRLGLRQFPVTGNHDASHNLALITEGSSAARLHLRIDLKKLGRSIVNCLADAARDSTTMWF
jgi:hypothetical protein